MAGPSSKQLSVVVPTYEEQSNIEPLTKRLFAAAKKKDIEVDLLFVDDDSGKGTEESEKIVKRLQKEYPVRIHVRRKGEGRGLSSAVVLGFQKAKHGTILCMDADLQHEPEAVPSVAAPVLSGQAEFSVGSRNVDGGSIGENWPLHRRIISKVATLLAWPVAASTDPMSGFFCTSKKVFQRGESSINATGFKIGLEMMVRCRVASVKDVGISFKERVAGESKLSAKQNVQYLLQLLSLYMAYYPKLFLTFVFLVVWVVVFIPTKFILLSN